MEVVGCEKFIYACFACDVAEAVVLDANFCYAHDGDLICCSGNVEPNVHDRGFCIPYDLWEAGL